MVQSHLVGLVHEIGELDEGLLGVFTKFGTKTLMGFS